MNWTELNALLKFEIPATWNFKRRRKGKVQFAVCGLRFPIKNRMLKSMLIKIIILQPAFYLFQIPMSQAVKETSIICWERLAGEESCSVSSVVNQTPS